MSKDTEAIITAIKMLHEEHKARVMLFADKEKRAGIEKAFDDFGDNTERIIEGIYED